MTDDILDITKWGKEYPFLKHVSEIYDKYNSDMYDDGYLNLYGGLCDTVMSNIVYGDATKHKEICMKLMRNLGYHSVVRQDYELSRYRCNILFHWLYNSYNEDKITYNIIDKCFEMYDQYSTIKENTDMKCYYHKDHIFYEPTKITLLDIFNDNIDTINETLKGVNLSMRNLGRKYVCECVKIYKYMNDKYCDNGKGKNQYYDSTCLKLNNFRDSYGIFYNNQVDSIFKIPSLDNVASECLDKLPSSEQKVPLAVHDGGHEIPPYVPDLTEDDTDTDDPLSGRLRGPLVNGDSSMKKSITTTIGTVAGASSLLALLYKFSPGGNWIRSGFRGGRGTINSNLYAGPNEILFDGMEHNDFNSYSIGYEAM